MSEDASLKLGTQNMDTEDRRATLSGDGDHRCFSCNRLLGRSHPSAVVTDLEIKCPRCGVLNTIFKNTTDQVIITDTNGVIIYTNDSVETVTGYTREEILGKTPKLWGGQMSTEFYKAMWRSIRDERTAVSVRVTNRKKDGSLYEAQLRISPVLDEHDAIKFYIGIETVIAS